MAGSTTKKAIVRRIEKESLAGYVNPLSYLQLTGVELLTEAGVVVNVPYAEIRSVAFVKDFTEGTDESRRTFHTRPKMEGLWVRFRWRDGDIMEAVMPNNLLPVEPFGFTVIPPDPYSNQHRLFIPRATLAAVEVLGVVGSPLKRKARPAVKEQATLFDEEPRS